MGALLGGFAGTALVGPFVSHTVPQPMDLCWGALSGVGTGIAMTFDSSQYRRLLITAGAA